MSGKVRGKPHGQVREFVLSWLLRTLLLFFTPKTQFAALLGVFQVCWSFLRKPQVQPEAGTDAGHVRDISQGKDAPGVIVPAGMSQIDTCSLFRRLKWDLKVCVSMVTISEFS